MRISYDEAKRAAVLAERGLDFEDAAIAFAGLQLTRADHAHSDDEQRFQTLGLIREDVVLIVWTERSDSRRIITMWKANARVREDFFRATGGAFGGMPGA